ncbi:CoA pyrophosphatase [Coralliovum pocilloporae]|uniref:CoA pyrophosphatase n=1 Tax=Coralliovum pocilloporae TaxID=3066369 RepID=UPI00330759CC
MAICAGSDPAEMLTNFLESVSRVRLDDPFLVASSYGDHMINPGLPPMEAAQLRDAAVLVPIVSYPGEPKVLLTQRTNHLPSHAGQVAFPGGKIDASDASAVHAALRETEEEIGIPEDLITVHGALPTYQSRSGYRIVPVIGLIEPGYDLALNEGEVELAFEVPLSFLMDPDQHRKTSRIWQGNERFFYEMPYDGHYIWGVTAGIIRSIYLELYG